MIQSGKDVGGAGPSYKTAQHVNRTTYNRGNMHQTRVGANLANSGGGAPPPHNEGHHQARGQAYRTVG